MKRSSRKLSLNKETVRTLSSQGLRRIAGGKLVDEDDVFYPTVDTCPITRCGCSFFCLPRPKK